MLKSAPPSPISETAKEDTSEGVPKLRVLLLKAKGISALTKLRFKKAKNVLRLGIPRSSSTGNKIVKNANFFNYIEKLGQNKRMSLSDALKWVLQDKKKLDRVGWRIDSKGLHRKKQDRDQIETASNRVDLKLQKASECLKKIKEDFERKTYDEFMFKTHKTYNPSNLRDHTNMSPNEVIEYCSDHEKRANMLKKLRDVSLRPHIVKDFQLDMFIKNHFKPANIPRMKTFEKFAFTSWDKSDAILSDNLRKIRGDDPKTACATIDLWTEKDKLELQKIACFENDRETLKQYFYIKGVRSRNRSKRKSKIEDVSNYRDSYTNLKRDSIHISKNDSPYLLTNTRDARRPSLRYKAVSPRSSIAISPLSNMSQKKTLDISNTSIHRDLKFGEWKKSEGHLKPVARESQPPLKSIFIDFNKIPNRDRKLDN